MPPKKRGHSGGNSAGGSGDKGSRKSNNNKKKSKNSTITSFVTNNKERYRKAMEDKYIGTRVLLVAKEVYTGGAVPLGEKNHLFQYHVTSIDEDSSIAILEYDSKFIRKGGDTFENYPDELEEIKTGYKVECIKTDHELFNKYLAKSNANRNDVIDLEKKQKADQKMSALDSVANINQKFEEGASAYDLLEGEFKTKGPKELSTIQNGPREGEVKYTQMWGELYDMGLCHYCSISYWYHHKSNTFDCAILYQLIIRAQVLKLPV